MKQISIIVILLTSISVFSQECSCEDNFNWLKKTFEENDAGFAYALETKGKIAYKIHNDDYTEKIKHITDANTCLRTMAQWFTFFRTGHIGLNRIKNSNNTNTSITPLTDAEIIEKYKHAERQEENLTAFKHYLKTKPKLGYEGIWQFGNYTIGVKKVKETYIGFIIEADGVYWTKGQVKFKINADNTTEYYMQNHSKNEYKDTKLIGNNYLEIGSGFARLERTYPKLKKDPIIESYYKQIGTKMPYFEIMDSRTAYLRIPSFHRSHKQAIDSVIKANKTIITSTPNFIIDIRNNGGGSDSSYEELLPIIYTNPIRQVGTGFYSTTLNNKTLYDFLISPEANPTEDSKKWAKEIYDKLSDNLGEYVNIMGEKVSVIKYNTINEYPKNVGVIINKNNVSTAEQFLLAAKQSKKVKLYGTTTKGALDISNLIAVTSPCGDYEFEYCISRSYRVPDMAIDEKGIQPDFYIDSTIAKHEWLSFVSNALKA